MSNRVLPHVPTRRLRMTQPESAVESPAAAIDRALVRRFADGDDHAFVEIMNRYREKILSTTFGLLRNHADAEEVTQDTFVRAHRGLASFRGDSSLATWLYRIALNRSRNRYWYFFRRRRQDSISLDCALSDDNPATFSDLVADSGRDPAQEAAAREFAVSVERGMQRLPPDHREVLRLRNVLDRSYEEIALLLGISVGTVKSRIARARDGLRRRVEEHDGIINDGTAPTGWFLRARATYGRPITNRA